MNLNNEIDIVKQQGPTVIPEIECTVMKYYI
jgi:hypothetical protein